MQVYELFLQTESANSSFPLIKCDSDTKSWNVIRSYRAQDWPMLHQSKVTITLLQIGDRDVRYKKSTKLILLHENIPKPKIKGLSDNWEKNFWKKMKGLFL